MKQCENLRKQLMALTQNSSRHAKAEWLFVSQQHDLSENRQKQLQRLREDNRLLSDLYPVAEMIRTIWKTKDLADAKHLIKTTRLLLLQIAQQHQFKPARSFASMMLRRMDGIMFAGAYGFNTARLEGANNKIKVIKRVAFGFKDMEYFFLKIKKNSLQDRLRVHFVSTDYE